MIKRVFDVLVSASALIILFIPILIISILVFLKLGSPIFFRQDRPGLNENIFQLIKFRTMNNDIHQSNPNEMMVTDSERLTKFGAFLRSRSLDELPTLINVLKGDMSLVGPRPLLVKYLPLYTSEEKRRHNVKPGITGWAQVNGRNTITWEKKFQYDLWYVENQTLFLDLKILFLTIKKVLLREGIDSPGNVSGEEFVRVNEKNQN